MGEPRAAPAAVLALLANAFVWGVSWWPFRTLHGLGVHPLWSTALVYAIALAWLLAVRPAAVRSFGRSPWLWLLMLGAGLSNVGFNWAVTIGDVVRVVLLFYLMPAWSVLLAWPLLGERPTVAAAVRVALALAGVAIVLGMGETGWPWPRSLPDWLALAGGLGFAFATVLLRKLHATPAEARALAMFGGGALLAAGVAGWASLQGRIPVLPMPQPGWVAVALALTAAFLVGNLALQYGAARLAAHTTALVMLSEVLFASLSAVALGAAELSPRVLLGGALIVGAAAWSAWPATRSAGGRRTMPP